MVEQASRASLWRWLGWFGIANAVVLGIIGLQYLGGGKIATTPLAWLYLVTVYTSHHAVLALLPAALLCAPLILLAPRRMLVMGAAVVCLAAIIAIVQLDSLLWSQSRFHFNLLTARILGWQSWLFMGLMFLIALLFEAMLARGVWNWLQAGRRRYGGWLASLMVLCLLVAQGIYAWADAAYYTPVTSVSQQLPVYRGFTAKSNLRRWGLVDIQQSRERELARRVARDYSGQAAGNLQYPLEPLNCKQDEPLNVLIILIDSWRFDMLSDEVTPGLAKWGREHAVQFEQHYSGGNSSRMGVFSFFYGLPPGYFNSFEALQRPALMVEHAQANGYQMGLFASADMYRPVTLDRTAFASVPNLRATNTHPEWPPWQRDKGLLPTWRDWLDTINSEQPFFGFLFFDSANRFNPPPGYAQRFATPPGHPMAEQFERYQQALHHIDSLVAQVLDDVQHRGLLDSTVVLVTADHGEEFQESGPEFSGHGSDYSQYQLHVPLLLHWPGVPAGSAMHRSSHYDVAPTFMERLYGCSNDPATYAAGNSLFDGADWPWLLAGSYFNYAMLEPDQITVTLPSGIYEVRDLNYQLLSQPEFRGDVLEQVMELNRRFYR